jgi:hypothetical protein
MLDLIGTAKYPLVGKRDERVDFKAGGERIADEGLAKLIRQLHKERPFMAGACYSNTERVCQNAWPNGWLGKIKPYAGWVVFDRAQAKPVHHAWAVLNGTQIIDMTTLARMNEIEAAYMEHWEQIKKDWKGDAFSLNVAWREDWVRRLMPLEDGDPVDNRIWGVVPAGMTYIGCPCLWEDARLSFNSWWSKNKKHQQYPGPGEKSPTQAIAQLVREGRTPQEILEICRRDFAERT